MKQGDTRNVSLESNFLCELMRAFLTGDRIRSVPRQLDLTELQRLLVNHKVATTFAPVMIESGMDAEFCKKLARASAVAGQNNTIMLLELTRFLEKLKQAQCTPVVLKGAGLAQAIYPSIDQRFFADLDILVPLDKVVMARKILEELGYVPSETPASIEYYAKHHFHLIMISPGGITVEVHWNLTPPNSNYQFNIERFSSRARTIGTPNGPILIPNPTDQLLHCVFQNIADGFSGLRRVIDASLILPLIQDETNLIKEAKEQNLGTGLWAVLNLVQELTSTVVSRELMEQLRPSNFIYNCFECFDLPGNCLEQRALKTELLNHWADWLCLPNSRLAARGIWHYLLPRSEDYFYFEHQFGAPPAWPQRIKISLSHLYYLLGHSARLAWELSRKNKTLSKAI